MKTFLQILTITAVTAGAIYSPSVLANGPACRAALMAHPRVVVETNPAQLRKLVAEVAVARGVPVVAKPTRTGLIPVIMVNAQTYPHLQDVFATTMGIQSALQPGYKNDHGQLRIDGVLIDADLPGYRGYGEINNTGLAWKELNTFVPRNGRHIVETVFKLSPSELETAYYYQKMRKAAIVRVPFAFGGANNRPIGNNYLRNTGEHCFTFCSGANLQSQISSIRSEMSRMGVQSVEILMQDQGVRNFLAKAKSQILAADYKDARVMNDLMLANIPEGTALFQRADLGLSHITTSEQRVTLLNWLVGLHASTGYDQILTELGVSRGASSWGDINNPRATAVFIYTGQTDARTFLSPNFQAPGVFGTWSNQGIRPMQELLQ